MKTRRILGFFVGLGLLGTTIFVQAKDDENLAPVVIDKKVEKKDLNTAESGKEIAEIYKNLGMNKQEIEGLVNFQKYLFWDILSSEECAKFMKENMGSIYKGLNDPNMTLSDALKTIMNNFFGECFGSLIDVFSVVTDRKLKETEEKLKENKNTKELLEKKEYLEKFKKYIEIMRLGNTSEVKDNLIKVVEKISEYFGNSIKNVDLSTLKEMGVIPFK